MVAEAFVPADVVDLGAEAEAALDDLVGEIAEEAEAPPPTRRAKPGKKAEADPDTDNSDDDSVEDDDTDESESGYEDSSDDDEVEDDEDSEFDDEDSEDIEAIRAERDRLRAEKEAARLHAEREEEARKARETQAKWDNLWAEGQRYWKGRKEAVYAAAQKSPNPTAYIRANLDRIEQDQGVWEADFNKNYAKPRTQASVDLAIRTAVAEARVEYGLSESEATKLLKFARKFPDAELISERLEEIIESRSDAIEAGKRTSKRVRQQAAKELASKTPRVGQGRRTTKKPKDLNEYVDSLNLPSFN